MVWQGCVQLASIFSTLHLLESAAVHKCSMGEGINTHNGCTVLIQLYWMLYKHVEITFKHFVQNFLMKNGCLNGSKMVHKYIYFSKYTFKLEVRVWGCVSGCNGQSLKAAPQSAGLLNCKLDGSLVAKLWLYIWGNKGMPGQSLLH